MHIIEHADLICTINIDATLHCIWLKPFGVSLFFFVYLLCAHCVYMCVCFCIRVCMWYVAHCGVLWFHAYIIGL